MILNWGILKHPLNWFTVVLMTIIGFMLLNVILTPWHLPQKNQIGLDANSEPGPTLMWTQ